MTFKVGDLVQVVRATTCCGEHTPSEGAFFVVKESIPHHDEKCCFCNAPLHTQAVFGLSHGLSIRADRLKKIDPPAEGETREAYKNLKVPA